MATVHEPRNRARYDAFLETRLERAARKVRGIDIARGLLGLTALTLGFGLVMVVVDRMLDLPLFVRQAALAGFVATAGWYAWRTLVGPLSSRVNPYFAARQVERAVAGSKNSLVSWLDFRERSLAPSVRNAVGRAAVGELEQVNLDDAVRDPRLGRVSALTALLAVALIALVCVFRPAQFFSLLARTFSPFAVTTIATQTQISIVEPRGGDVAIPLNHSVDVRVEVAGRTPRADAPDAIRLRMRYASDDPVWEEKRLEPTERAGEWFVRVPAAQVRNGFDYQVVGGDAETAVHRVTVRARPMITDFEVRYRYRPYLRMADDVRNEPNLQAVRGTAVTLRAKSNRAVREGSLVLKPAGDKPEVVAPGRPVPDQPDVLEFQFVLNDSGQYRIRFTTADGEPGDETIPFDVRVLPDLPPEVVIPQPAPKSLPVNGTLALTSRATDDYGVTAARIMLAVQTAPNVKAEQLPPVRATRKPARQPESADNRKWEWKEVIALDKLADVAGHKLDLKPGMVIIYRAEADDNCDLPGPQTGSSPEFRVTLTDPMDQVQRDQERANAEQEKKEHEGGGQANDGGQGQPGENEQPGEQPAQDKPRAGDGPGQGNDDKTLEQAKRIADAIRDREREGQGNPDQQQLGQSNPGDGKLTGNEQSGENRQQQMNDKPGGQKGDGQDPGKQGEAPGGDSTPQTKGATSGDPVATPPGGDPNTTPGPGKNPAGQRPDTATPQPGADGSRDTPPNPPRPDQANQPGHQRDNKNQSAPSQPQKGDGTNPAVKSPDTPEKTRPGDTTEKSGEKPGPGAKDDKPNDTAPKTSPDKGNADGGQGGSQRSGEMPKTGDKPEKGDEAALSGKSDPNAGAPEGEKPRGANAEGDRANNAGKPTRPDAGPTKPNPNPNDATKPQATEDAAQPHAQPGSKPNAEPKTGGTSAQADPSAKPSEKGRPAAGDKPTGSSDPARPENIQKLVDAFKNADPKTQEQIREKLQEMARNAPTPEQKRQAEQACEECQGGGSTQGKNDSQKPGSRSGADGSASKPGETKGKAGERPGGRNDVAKAGTKPGQETGNPGGSEGPTDATAKKPDPAGRPDEKGQPGDGQKPGDQPMGQPEGKSGEGLAQGRRDGKAEPKSGPTGEATKAPNEEYLRRAGDLQLDDFKRKVDRKTLERLKMTEAEYQQFLKSYEDLLKRQSKGGLPGADDKVRGSGLGGSSANSGARKVEAGPKSGPDTQRAGRGQAPPEFRDQYRDFTSEQSRQDKKK